MSWDQALEKQHAQRREHEFDEPQGQAHQGLHPEGTDHAGHHQGHDDEEAPGLDTRDQHGLLVGQQSDQDATPVQRRQRKQVEDEHHDIDQDPALAHLDEEGLVDPDGGQQVEQHHPAHGLQEVDPRPCQRDPDHVALGVAQVAEVHRDGPGVAEQERADHDHHDGRRHAQRVDQRGLDLGSIDPGRVGLLIEVSGSSIQPLDVGSKSCLLLRRKIGDRHLDRDFRRRALLRTFGRLWVWDGKIAALIEIMLIHGWPPTQPVWPQGEIDRLEYRRFAGIGSPPF